MVGMYVYDDIIAQRLVRECREAAGTSINFAPLSMHQIPQELAELTQLTEINFDAEHDGDGFHYHGASDLLEVPEFFGAFTRLETLNIGCTCMVKFPPSLRNLTALKTLVLPSITHSQSPSLEIDNFGSFLRCWKQLEHLNLSVENIPALAECIDELPNLKSLGMSLYGLDSGNSLSWEKRSNPASYYQKNIIMLLEKLAARNNFTGLTLHSSRNDAVLPLVGEITSLKKLELDWRNESKALPDCFGKLVNLRELSLESDCRHLPSSFARCTKLERLHLKTDELQELPEYISGFSALKYLFLENVPVKALPDYIGNLTALEELRIIKTSFRGGFQEDEDNTVSVLPRSIGNLSALKKLELNNTRLGSLPESIKGLSSLEELILHDNTFTEFPPELAALKSLKLLNILGSYKTMPAFIGDYPNLEELIFAYCSELETVPASIGNLRSLQRLGFFGSTLEALPDSVGNLSNLEALAVYNNGGSIKRLPETITNCRNLRRLRLQGLEQFPKNIGNLTNLVKIETRDGRFESIPESIGNCIKMRELTIDSGKLKNIPESIGNLTILKELKIRLNNGSWDYKPDSSVPSPLKTLPESIGNLFALRTLDIAAESLEMLPDSIGDLHNLEVLHISAPLKNLPESIGNCTALKEFELSPDETYSALPKRFSQLRNIQTIRITDCAIETLPDLSNWASLRVLELMYLRLRTLPETIGRLPSLQYLRVLGMPLGAKPEVNGEFVRLTALPDSIGNLSQLRYLDIEGCGIKEFPQSMSNLAQWEGVAISAKYMTPLLESLATLKHLPYIEVTNPTIRRIPKALKSRKDFYHNGDKKSPRISAVITDDCSVTFDSFVERLSVFEVLQRIGMRIGNTIANILRHNKEEEINAAKIL